MNPKFQCVASLVAGAVYFFVLGLVEIGLFTWIPLGG